MKHFKIDYKDTNKIITIIKKYKIKYIFPAANDLTIYTLYKISKDITDKFKTLEIIHNKFYFRKFYKKIKFQELSKDTIKIKTPYLIKPVLGSGGKKIKLIRRSNQLSKFLLKDKKSFILEEYISGTDHGVFTLVKNKKILFSFFDSEQRYINKFTVSSTSSISNLSKETEEKNDIQSNTFKIVKIKKNSSLNVSYEDKITLILRILSHTSILLILVYILVFRNIFLSNNLKNILKNL